MPLGSGSVLEVDAESLKIGQNHPKLQSVNKTA